MVYGHSHSTQVHTLSTACGVQPRQAICCPMFAEEGRVEDYAKGGSLGWTYGFVVINERRDTGVPDMSFISTNTLMEEYG